MRYHTHQEFNVTIAKPKTQKDLAIKCQSCGETLTSDHLKQMYGGANFKDWTGGKLLCDSCHSATKVQFQE